MKISKEEFEYLEKMREKITKDFENVNTMEDYINFNNKYKDFPFINNYCINFAIK